MVSKPDTSPKGERIIAVMGSTGVGKSSFIHNSMPPGTSTNIKVGHSLKSETSEVQPVCWDAEDGTRIKLVDTPGFDDSREGVTDVQVLKMIATFLTERHGANSRLTGLIYIHRISDTRVGGTSQRNLRMFRKLCGTDSLKNVAIVTTMWDQVTPEEGSRLEQELRSNDSPFKPLLDEGAAMMRHERSAESATRVINYLLGKSPTTTQIVRELLQEKKTLEETAAGTELRSDIQALLKRHGAEMESLRTEMMRELERGLAEERRRIEQHMTKLLKELDELKQGIPGAIRSDPPPVYELANRFSAPDTKCIVHCSQLLRLAKTHKSSLAPVHPDVLSSVASRTLHFANAVERSVRNVQYESSTLKSVLESEDVFMLQQFKADPHPRTFTLGTWANARHDMEIFSNELDAILYTYYLKHKSFRIRNGKVKRSKALNAILASTKEIVSDMTAMVSWWTPIIDALGKVEDATHRMRGMNGIDDSAVMVSITRITRALDSYCEAYAGCPEELHKAASGISL